MCVCNAASKAHDRLSEQRSETFRPIEEAAHSLGRKIEHVCPLLRFGIGRNQAAGVEVADIRDEGGVSDTGGGAVML